MATNYVPRAVKLDLVDGYKAEILKVALFNMPGAWTLTDNDSTDTYTEFIATYTEVSHANYTAGGYTLVNKTTAYDVNKDAYLDNTVDPSWTNVSFTTTHAVLYENTNKKIRGIYDLGGSKIVTTGTFSLLLSASGLFSITS